MVISRAPMCIDLFGGFGFDCGLSAAINKYIYIVANSTPLSKDISVRYSAMENVSKVDELKNERARLSLIETQVDSGIEIGSFATFPLVMGFNSHQSYTSALLRALYKHLNKSMSPKDLINKVFDIERKVDSNKSISSIYTTCMGGFNIFSTDDSKNFLIQPQFISFHDMLKFEDSLCVFNIQTKKTKSKNGFVSVENSNDMNGHLKDLISEFVGHLNRGDIAGCGYSLHKGWLQEQGVGQNKSNEIIEDIYRYAISSGCLGGKYIGDQYGGNLLLVGSDDVFQKVNKKLQKNKNLSVSDFKISFIQSGTEILYNL